MGMMSRYLNWCKNPTGQKFGTSVCIGLNLGVFSAIYFPHTFLLQKWKELIQLYERKKPVEVPEDMKNLFNEVLDDLKIEKYDRVDLEPFIVCRLKPFHAGMFNSSTGGIIGIPWHFTYEQLIDVKIPRISLYKFPVDASRVETEKLAESLVLSRAAKKFAIAREICSLRDSNYTSDALLASAIFFICFSFSQFVKHKFQLYKKSLMSRVFLYTMTGFVGVTLYFSQKDYFTKSLEKQIDAELAKLSNDYLQGGLEYYSKLLTANLAQRELLDKYGEKTYDEKGDPAYFIRQKSTPISERKLFFEMLAGAEKV